MFIFTFTIVTENLKARDSFLLSLLRIIVHLFKPRTRNKCRRFCLFNTSQRTWCTRELIYLKDKVAVSNNQHNIACTRRTTPTGSIFKSPIKISIQEWRYSNPMQFPYRCIRVVSTVMIYLAFLPVHPINCRRPVCNNWSTFVKRHWTHCEANETNNIHHCKCLLGTMQNCSRYTG